MKRTKKYALIFIAFTVFLSGALYINKNTRVYVIKPLETALLPVQNAKTGAVNIYKSIKNSKKYKQENFKLKEENAYLKNELDKTKIVSQENARLRELLKLTEQKRTLNLTVCEVIAKQDTHIKINKGKNHGIYENDIAILNNTLIGKVEAAGSSWAKILLTVSSDLSVGVKGERSGVFSVSSGDKALAKEGKLKLMCTNGAQNLIIGENVITTGESSLYPKGLKIGMVLSKDDDSAILKTDIDFGTISEVLILKRGS